MKNSLKSMMIVLVLSLLVISPVAAHSGCELGNAVGVASAKQCPQGCDKPCCAAEKDKTCSMKSKKEGCEKSACDKKMKHGHAKMNFVPGNRR